MITYAFAGVAAIHNSILGLLFVAPYALFLLYIKTFKNTIVLTVVFKNFARLYSTCFVLVGFLCALANYLFGN